MEQLKTPLNKESNFDISSNEQYYLRGLLILLVIFGHVLEYSLNSKLNQIIYIILYFFHVPLLVFLSGYASKKYNSFKVWDIVKYLILGEITFLLLAYFNNNFLSLPILKIDEVYWVMWFLRSLLIWKVVGKYLYPFIKNKMYIALLFYLPIIGISVTMGKMRTVTLLPIFLLGMIYSENTIYITKYSKHFIAISSFYIPLVLYQALGTKGILVIYQKVSIYALNIGLLEGILLRLFYIMGTISLISLIIYLYKTLKIKFNFLIVSIGKSSLFYYLSHGFIILLLRSILEQRNLFELTIISVLIIIFLFILNKSITRGKDV